MVLFPKILLTFSNRFTDKRIKNEKELSNYIEKRLAWFEQLRSHIENVPLMDRTDTTRNVVREKVLLLLFLKICNKM